MEHRTRTVSHVGKCRVEQCSCGTVHLSVGGTTVRTTAKTASDLHSALATLVSELARADDAQGTSTGSGTGIATGSTAPGQSRSRRADATVHDHAPDGDKRKAEPTTLPNNKGKTIH